MQLCRKSSKNGSNERIIGGFKAPPFCSFTKAGKIIAFVSILRMKDNKVKEVNSKRNKVNEIKALL